MSLKNFLSRDWFVVLAICLISLTLSVHCSQPTSGTTVTSENTDSNNNTIPHHPNNTVLLVASMNKDISSPTETGFHSTDLNLVIGCVFVFAIAFLSVIVFAIYRYQVRKKAEYQRAAKIQVSSTRNAGVYMDLAMESPISKSNLPISVPIYNSMKKRQDQYTFISDDELDL